MQQCLQTGRKHCGERRNCLLQAISPFPTVFSEDLYCRHVKTRACLGKGQISGMQMCQLFCQTSVYLFSLYLYFYYLVDLTYTFLKLPVILYNMLPKSLAALPSSEQ